MEDRHENRTETFYESQHKVTTAQYEEPKVVLNINKKDPNFSTLFPRFKKRPAGTPPKFANFLAFHPFKNGEVGKV